MLRFTSIAILMLGACATDNDNTGRDGGNGWGSNGSQATDCGETLDCAFACGTDQSCSTRCFDAASDDAQQGILAVELCLSANSCTDWACVELKCDPELDACYGDSSHPDPGPGTGGSQGTPLPPDLVGAWSSFSASGTSGALLTYVFTPDGSVSHSGTLQFGTGCQTTFHTAYAGYAVLSGDELTLQSTSGSTTTSDCNGNVSSSGPYSDTEHFVFQLGADAEGETLALTNLDNGNTVTFRR